MKECYDLANKKGMPLLCAFNRRYDPTFNQIRDRIKSGEIGQVHVIKSCSRDSPVPSIEYLKTSGGIFHDCAVHDIDLICWMLGEYPTSVSSQANTFIPEIKEIDDFDTVVITMKFPSGALATIDLSRSSTYGYDQRIEVFGQTGMLTANEYRPTHVVAHNNKGTTQVPICYSFASRYFEAYTHEMELFLKAIRGETEIDIKDYQTLAVQRIASACEESARTGKVVEVKYD